MNNSLMSAKIVISLSIVVLLVAGFYSAYLWYIEFTQNNQKEIVLKEIAKGRLNCNLQFTEQPQELFDCLEVWNDTVQELKEKGLL